MTILGLVLTCHRFKSGTVHLAKQLVLCFFKLDCQLQIKDVYGNVNQRATCLLYLSISPKHVGVQFLLSVVPTCVIVGRRRKLTTMFAADQDGSAKGPQTTSAPILPGVCFATACAQLRQAAVHVNKAWQELRRARHQVNELRRKMRQEQRQEQRQTPESTSSVQPLATPLLQAAIADRATKMQTLQEAWRTCDEYMRVVPNCNPKPLDWKEQVAAALIRN